MFAVTIRVSLIDGDAGRKESAGLRNPSRTVRFQLQVKDVADNQGLKRDFHDLSVAQDPCPQCHRPPGHLEGFPRPLCSHCYVLALPVSICIKTSNQFQHIYS